ncbi:MAG: hypothetical protein FJX63_07005 [Alphaproteobacteria bacterium]|nr:hypothetical protein [Alphaproteobacteria bacterium]
MTNEEIVKRVNQYMGLVQAQSDGYEALLPMLRDLLNQYQKSGQALSPDLEKVDAELKKRAA